MVKKLSDSALISEVRRGKKASQVADRTEPRALEARYDRDSGLVELKLANGCRFAFPASRTEGLSRASPELLERVEILGKGYALRWEELDADLTVPGLLAGRLGSLRWMASELGRAGGRTKSAAKARAARANGRKGGRPRRAAADR